MMTTALLLTGPLMLSLGDGGVMLQQLFGAELDFWVRLAISLIVIAVLLGITAIIMRRMGRKNTPVGMVRQRSGRSRIAVVDAVPVDQSRRLVLVRRDDKEHLLLTGGATDVVVEHNIPVRAESPTPLREAPSQKLRNRRPENQQPLEAPQVAPALGSARPSETQQPALPASQPESPSEHISYAPQEEMARQIPQADETRFQPRRPKAVETSASEKASPAQMSGVQEASALLAARGIRPRMPLPVVEPQLDLPPQVPAPEARHPEPEQIEDTAQSLASQPESAEPRLFDPADLNMEEIVREAAEREAAEQAEREAAEREAAEQAEREAAERAAAEQAEREAAERAAAEQAEREAAERAAAEQAEREAAERAAAEQAEREAAEREAAEQAEREAAEREAAEQAEREAAEREAAEQAEREAAERAAAEQAEREAAERAAAEQAEREAAERAAAEQAEREAAERAAAEIESALDSSALEDELAAEMAEVLQTLERNADSPSAPVSEEDSRVKEMAARLDDALNSPPSRPHLSLSDLLDDQQHALPPMPETPVPQQKATKPQEDAPQADTPHTNPAPAEPASMRDLGVNRFGNIFGRMNSGYGRQRIDAAPRTPAAPARPQIRTEPLARPRHVAGGIQRSLGEHTAPLLGPAQREPRPAEPSHSSSDAPRIRPPGPMTARRPEALAAPEPKLHTPKAEQTKAPEEDLKGGDFLQDFESEIANLLGRTPNDRS
ncbi:flagellar biosynthetic protein FliO [Xanthobacter sp. TB0139]|uniref:flagellar biosynthetic protein FliO n=1 Tax=Xanthobacter sp. TB0139 TaxID=3459178 RepID=UPI00403922A0